MERNSVASAMIGAAVGAVIGAACLAAVLLVDNAVFRPTNLYAPATVARPAVTSTLPLPANGVARRVQTASTVSAQAQTVQAAQEVTMQQPEGIAVYSWAWVLLAAVGGAVNALYLRNQRVAMAATTSRRDALLAGAAAAGLAAGPAFAAYGDPANVFGKPKESDQTFTAKGDGWSVTLPRKYTANPEREVPGTVARWEDGGDQLTNAYVVVRQVGKNSITEVGDLENVRNNIVTPLLGYQAFDGPSISEGGFAPGRYASAAVLEQKQETRDGKVYYYYEILGRSSDNNEGGRHLLFVVTASNGKLIIFRHQAGDKRWFRGMEKPIRSSIAAFRAI